MNYNNISKMELLKRRNRRNNLIKELSPYVRIPDTPFFDIEVNSDFCDKAYEKVDTICDKLRIQGENYENTIELSKNYLINFINSNSFENDFARLLFFREHEIEAVKVPIKDIIDNINSILEIMHFNSGYSDFILIDENFRFGICIERTEYFHEFCSWGVN